MIVTNYVFAFYNFKQRIVDWLAQNFKRDEGIDLLKDKQALQRLTETAEKAKMELSTLTQTNIRYVAIFMPFLYKWISLFGMITEKSFLFFQFTFHYCHCRWPKTH